jgi:hypothetical protein
LVNLAVTIRDDGQVNPLTVVDVSQGVTQQFRIETGERRYWATWLLRDFIAGYTGDGMIPCIIIPAERSSVFRQAKENTARAGLSTIAMARQAALLLLTVHEYEIPSGELWSPLVALAAFFEEQGQIEGLLEAIARVAESDEQVSEGKALSDREEAVLQALEILTRGQIEIVWVKSAILREQVAKLVAQPVEKLGDAQWIGHILKRLHLLDDARRKRAVDGMVYAVQPAEVIDMMRRYDVAVIQEST